MTHPAPSAARPLQGLTVLLVEDSRFASEAMRLLCLRSGARIRRADSLRAAHRHLATYRPSAVIVDMGLPDGSGADLIRELAALQPRMSVILGTSGSDDLEALALAAGADGFLPKPIESLALFQTAVLAALPPSQRPSGPRALPGEIVHPDLLALRDDLVLAAGLLAGTEEEGNVEAGPLPSGSPHAATALDSAPCNPAAATGTPATLDYVAQFLGGLARISHDRPLAEAATALQQDRAAGRETRADHSRLSRLVQARLAAGAPI
ncbi:response regulator [Frigidibacter albus]|uniref:Response regulator n=1 Tax=Frigidibacter albus TaxID=1465486 RepID=A0A6L8VF07_9RHOB|nr:response regulator [Frigidibacter albus]MZQ88947.1 response regulator [Frigidibacter albus]NBE30996.1 response regulator [Frigidibacter albus]